MKHLYFKWVVVVAISACAVSAADRFKEVDGGQSIVDRETTLVWEKNADRKGPATWSGANGALEDMVNGDALSTLLDGKNKPGGSWRFPTKDELIEIIAEHKLRGAASPFKNLANDVYFTADRNVVVDAITITSQPSIGAKQVAHFWLVRGVRKILVPPPPVVPNPLPPAIPNPPQPVPVVPVITPLPLSDPGVIDASKYLRSMVSVDKFLSAARQDDANGSLYIFVYIKNDNGIAKQYEARVNKNFQGSYEFLSAMLTSLIPPPAVPAGPLNPNAQNAFKGDPDMDAAFDILTRMFFIVDVLEAGSGIRANGERFIKMKIRYKDNQGINQGRAEVVKPLGKTVWEFKGMVP